MSALFRMWSSISGCCGQMHPFRAYEIGVFHCNFDARDRRFQNKLSCRRSDESGEAIVLARPPSCLQKPRGDSISGAVAIYILNKTERIDELRNE